MNKTEINYFKTMHQALSEIIGYCNLMKHCLVKLVETHEEKGEVPSSAHMEPEDE